MANKKKTKDPQWKIDRAFNLNLDNEERLRVILYYCHEVKMGKLAKEDAGKMIVENNAAKSIERYEKSTATVMRSYGFIQEAYCTTEISDLFLSGKISYSELVLLQLIKKEYKYDKDSEIIKPLYVVLRVLLYLHERDINYCWIDAYDYQKYLTEISNYDQINKIAEEIYFDKVNKEERLLEYSVNHFDIWYSIFITSNLFKKHENGKKMRYPITLNLEQIELIRFLIENYQSEEVYNSYEIPTGTTENKIKNLANFGKVNASIFSMMPSIEIEEIEEINNLITDDKRILTLYLIEGKSFREIDEKILGKGSSTQGFFSKMIISKKYGINNKDYKGIWKPFKNNNNFIKHCPKYNKIRQIISTIFGGNDMENRKIIKKRNKRVDGIYPFNRILYGAPGTGKTYSTGELSIAVIEKLTIVKTKETYNSRELIMDRYKEYIENEQIVFTTFHQSYGYEDFIQGLRPNPQSEHLSFKLVDGCFKKISEKALNDDQNNYVIIIDEINRGNISKIFGELITLIEEDKRWGELNQMSVTLPSGEPFAVPNNLYIIGTMNSADKSISLLDTALRRRFQFVEQKPNADLIEDEELQEIFKKLNSVLVRELDSTDLLIGHSYFINKKIEEIDQIFNNGIIPLLYEYFYDNRTKISSVLAEVLGKDVYKVVDEHDGRISILRLK